MPGFLAPNSTLSPFKIQCFIIFSTKMWHPQVQLGKPCPVPAIESSSSSCGISAGGSGGGSGLSDSDGFSKGCRIVFGFFFASSFGFFFGFLSRYHLPCICNSLELEPVILHGICYILAWSLCILHGICYIWPRLPSSLHGICHILAFQPLICMVFATFWCFKRSCGSLEGSLSFHLGFHLRFH